MPKFFSDEKGKWIGSVSECGSKKTYLDGKGQLVARVHDNRTYDSKGAFKGPLLASMRGRSANCRGRDWIEFWDGVGFLPLSPSPYETQVSVCPIPRPAY